jgi:hypothetical protein
MFFFLSTLCIKLAQLSNRLKTGPVIECTKNKMADFSITGDRYVRFSNGSEYREFGFRIFTVVSCSDFKITSIFTILSGQVGIVWLVFIKTIFNQISTAAQSLHWSKL